LTQIYLAFAVLIHRKRDALRYGGVAALAMQQENAMKKLSLAITLALAAAAAAHAQDPLATPRIDQRAAEQQKRIQQGVSSGQLTPHETRRLERQQHRIARTEARAKSDGVVTARERARLTREQDEASHAIHRQKHDARHS
jgi:uncharacterized membrane protein YebE (DUF533 family)